MHLGKIVLAAWTAVSTPAATVQWGHIYHCKLFFFTIVTVMSPWLHPNLWARRDENALQTVWNDDTVNFIRQWCTMKHNHASYLGRGGAEKCQSSCQSPRWAVMCLIILISTEAGDSTVHMWKLRERLLLLKWIVFVAGKKDKIWVFQLSRVHAAGEACRSRRH